MILRVIGRGSCRRNRGRGEESVVRERMRDEDARWVRYSGLGWDRDVRWVSCGGLGSEKKGKKR